MASTSTHLINHLFLLLTLSAFVNAGVTGNGRFGEQDHQRLHARALTVSTNLPTGWTSQGCYTDSVNSRALNGNTYTGAAMTEQSCISFCNTNGYAYAGVEYSQECYCANTIGVSGIVAAAADCNMACSGDATQQCGGPNRLNVFHNSATTTTPAGPVTNPGPVGWGFVGCYTDSVAARTFPVAGQTVGGNTKLTVALCTQACQSAGYKIAGVEYSGECYCGNSYSNGGAPAPDGLTGCNMVCNGNSSEYCGGPNRLDVYGLGQTTSTSTSSTSTSSTSTTSTSTTSTSTSSTSKSTSTAGWSSLGCYTDTVAARTLIYGAAVLGGPNNMTIENCQNACQQQKYTLAGVEYAQECYCGNSLSNGGGPAPDGNVQCNMACQGNAAETCGGPNRLNMYSFAGTAASSATTTATISTSTPSSTGVAQSLPTGWAYRGCWVDNLDGRILAQQPDSSTLTVESCVAICVGLGRHVAGMEYSTQCFCGDAITNGGVQASQDSDCAMTCSGNSSEVCGGPNRMSIYAVGTFKSYPAPVAQTTNLGGQWQYQGCLTDIPQPRVLPYQIDMTNNLTIPNCLNLCSQYGYSAASVEYGQQCFCGDDTDRVNAGVTYRAATDCNTACPGDPTALCGGANAMNYYTWTSGINTWKQANGNAAGSYQFLIGGVVIPLITAVGTNGKVTFVEKHGTGPPNSTGAYELDLSQTDNFNNAWRTMNGLKTDVFCSAGLTLPDKVGRQINIGGWSTDSLFGIRLYWPDGSAGVPGVNDWQENVQEVALQTGRWYPSAMQMVNGSILVVGGENGSNGPPVPNLEIVPAPPGGNLVFCDWLNRTDPNNLYPFLAVLPSGGVFVAYYNEARILDPVTFQTKTVLPNIPGSVNNFLAGRTYPLEGTSMLLPQSAPYTDPLTVLICGGSAPPAGIALDNCVTIQPESANPTWTIERMPSARVISSMVALPDGTYLILNGAQQGVAGFGLATNPNHNALLYTPTAPLYSRFTRLANTTIDRLYHSEAILLLDGRILVSGSDPEGAPYVQEYRVEVFIPPYLMGVAESARPAYTITKANSDWAYDGSYTITMTQGTAAKISLMKAVSSTHGNSMGQRTIFPSYSCTGNTCTIKAPPSGTVTGGPGWFMVFVLDSNGVPSHAQWVRIGGDPASLGNWPNFSDFTLPGV